MFWAQQIFAIYNISLSLDVVANSEVYVYLEDQNDIVNVHLSKWDQSVPEAIEARDVIKVVTPHMIRSFVKFQLPLWIAATKALNIK